MVHSSCSLTSEIDDLGGSGRYTEGLVFLCRRPDSFKLSETARRALRRMRRRTFWIYLLGDEPVFETEIKRWKKG